MNQSTLFDPSRTSPTPCSVPGCQAIRFPGQQLVPTCEHDRDQAFQGWTRNRPRGCLNAYDPQHAEIPYP